MLVKVKGKGVKLNGIWKYKDETAEINDEEYEVNKEYVDILEDEETSQLPQIPNRDDEEPAEKELQELRAKARELGIRNAHLMKKESLEAAIAEKEAPLFGTKQDENPEGNPEGADTNSDGADTNVGGNDEGDATGESNPQE